MTQPNTGDAPPSDRIADVLTAYLAVQREQLTGAVSETPLSDPLRTLAAALSFDDLMRLLVGAVLQYHTVLQTIASSEQVFDMAVQMLDKDRDALDPVDIAATAEALARYGLNAALEQATPILDTAQAWVDEPQAKSRDARYDRLISPFIRLIAHSHLRQKIPYFYAAQLDPDPVTGNVGYVTAGFMPPDSDGGIVSAMAVLTGDMIAVSPIEAGQILNARKKAPNN